MSGSQTPPIAGPPEDRYPSTTERAELDSGLSVGELAEELERRLETCAECAALLEDLKDFGTLEPPSEDFDFSEEDLRRSLGSIRAQSLASAPSAVDTHRVRDSPETSPPVTPFRRKQDQGKLPWLQPLPWAALVLLGLGMSWWRSHDISRLKEQVAGLEEGLAAAGERLRRPQVNIPVIELLAADDPLRGPVQDHGLGGALVLLEPEEPLAPADYIVEISDRAGPVLSLSGLRPRGGGLTFYLPPEALDPGIYSVTIRTEAGEPWPAKFELKLGN